jgi:hypothetical protein
LNKNKNKIKMSLFLEKNKKYENLKKKQIKNNNKNTRHSQEKTYELLKSTAIKKSPRQKSFIMNKKKNRAQKSNDFNNTKNFDNMLDDNFLLSNENDPFSRSVIFSNKKMENNIFPNIKAQKKIDISNKKNPRIKLLSNKIFDDTRKRTGMARSVKNSNIKTNFSNSLNFNNDKSKFEDKYQLIEDKIIDKKYEKDIDHDEIIIGNKKDNKLFSNVQISKGNSNNNSKDLYSYFEKNNKSKNEDEFLINNNYENNKNDFCIMYIDNYEKMINDDMLSLEIQLLYEKILDLQNSYHDVYVKISNQYGANKKFFSLIFSKFKEIQKKKYNLSKIKDNIYCKNKINNYFCLQEKEHNSYLSEINNKEINLWKKMLGKNFKTKNNYFEIKDLFKKVVFNKYNNIKNHLNEIEKKLVLNLMKKNNFELIPDKVNTNNNNINAFSSKKTKNNKVIKTKISHKAVNSGGVYENNIKNSKNNKYNIFNNYYTNSARKKGH